MFSINISNDWLLLDHPPCSIAFILILGPIGYRRDARALPNTKSWGSNTKRGTGRCPLHTHTHAGTLNWLQEIRSRRPHSLLRSRPINNAFSDEGFNYSLGPKHVKPLSDMPHNVCVCRYHANFNYLIDIAQKDFINVASVRDFLNETCCNTENEDCMLGSCQRCWTVWDVIKQSVDQFTITTWKQWEKNRKLSANN
ncbi:unnamed protein product [Brassicogethes aeneus]|uniref:Uncharacterized protein n=1 Tax=Brassicogethes aeneus TaxID=1431903 RepID=A0A9P0ARM5_BRAAE|nr:unnamed protein product [Brassicogethes aeneus]